MNQTVYTCLWFNGDQAGDAAKFYCSIFKDAVIVSENPMVTLFTVGDMKIMALNGNTGLPFNDSASIVIECETQEEIDTYWQKLCEGGKEKMCGWLSDKYGVSWQILPKDLKKLMGNKEKSQYVMNALLKMKKININELMNA